MCSQWTRVGQNTVAVLVCVGVTTRVWGTSAGTCVWMSTRPEAPSVTPVGGSTGCHGRSSDIPRDDD